MIKNEGLIDPTNKDKDKSLHEPKGTQGVIQIVDKTNNGLFPKKPKEKQTGLLND